MIKAKIVSNFAQPRKNICNKVALRTSNIVEDSVLIGKLKPKIENRKVHRRIFSQ